MIFLNNNFVVESTSITASSENSSYKFSDALTCGHRAIYGRTTAITDQYIDIEFTAEQSIDYFAMLDDNLSATATIQLSANTSADLDNPCVTYTISEKRLSKLSDITDVTLNTFILIDENIDNIVDENGNYIEGFIDATTYKYWRVSISDTNNLNTYLQISKIFLSSEVVMPYMARNQKIPTASTSTVTETPTGQIYGDAGYFYRYGTFNFPYITDAQMLAIDAAFRIADKINPILLVIWEKDIDFMPPIYARFTTDMDWQRVENLSGRFWSLQSSFKEIL